MKKLKNSLDREGLLKMAWKFLKFLGKNRLKFVEKCKVVKIWGRISIGQAKLSNLPAKLSEFGPNVKKILKGFKKILRFFDQNFYEKWTFFTKYFLDFCLISGSIYLWKITPDLYNNFSEFFGGRLGCCARGLRLIKITDFNWFPNKYFAW